jgi:hypothetical protein
MSSLLVLFIQNTLQRIRVHASIGLCRERRLLLNVTLDLILKQAQSTTSSLLKYWKLW